MTVLFVGLSHATAPLSTIERVGFSAADAAATVACITSGDRAAALPLRELVIVSTCHRVELYGVPADDVSRPSIALDAMAQWLAQRDPDNRAIDAQIRRLVGTNDFRVPHQLGDVLPPVVTRVLADDALHGRVGFQRGGIDGDRFPLQQ